MKTEVKHAAHSLAWVGARLENEGRSITLLALDENGFNCADVTLPQQDALRLASAIADIAWPRGGYLRDSDDDAWLDLLVAADRVAEDEKVAKAERVA